MSKENEKLDLTAEPLRSLFVGARVERLLAAKQWPLAVAALRTALTACGTDGAAHHSQELWSADSRAVSEGDVAGEHGDGLPEERFSPASQLRRLYAAVNAVLDHAHALLHDLPGPHLDPASRHRIASVATELLDLCPLIADAPAANDAAAEEEAADLPPDVQMRCDAMLLQTEQLPHLPAVLQRGSEDKLRRMCITDAALVRPRPVSTLM